MYGDQHPHQAVYPMSRQDPPLFQFLPPLTRLHLRQEQHQRSTMLATPALPHRLTRTTTMPTRAITSRHRRSSIKCISQRRRKSTSRLSPSIIKQARPRFTSQLVLIKRRFKIKRISTAISRLIRHTRRTHRFRATNRFIRHMERRIINP